MARFLWDEATVRQIASKYTKKSEFFKHDNMAYQWAYRVKLLDSMCAHMEQKNKSAPIVDRTRVCAKCGCTQSVENFYVQSNGYMRPDCKDCTKATVKEYADKNRDRRLVYGAQHYQNNKAIFQQKSREYRSKPENRVKAAQKTAEWRKSNPDKVKSHYVTQKESGISKTYSARARKKRKDQIRVANRNYKAKKRSAEGHHTAADIQKIYEDQGCRCAACNVNVKNGYHVDHIVPLIRGGSNWPANLQILCPSCNLRKKDKPFDEFLRVLHG